MIERNLPSLLRYNIVVFTVLNKNTPITDSSREEVLAKEQKSIKLME
jgi:hypothetical protein